MLVPSLFIFSHLPRRSAQSDTGLARVVSSAGASVLARLTRASFERCVRTLANDDDVIPEAPWKSATDVPTLAAGPPMFNGKDALSCWRETARLAPWTGGIPNESRQHVISENQAVSLGAGHRTGTGARNNHCPRRSSCSQTGFIGGRTGSKTHWSGQGGV